MTPENFKRAVELEEEKAAVATCSKLIVKDLVNAVKEAQRMKGGSSLLNRYNLSSLAKNMDALINVWHEDAIKTIDDEFNAL